MQEELKIVKKSYKKVKMLFKQDLKTEDLIKADHEEILKSLQILKSNIILIPVIDDRAQLNEIENKINLLIENIKKRVDKNAQ